MRFLLVLVLCLAGAARVFAVAPPTRPLKLRYTLPHELSGPGRPSFNCVAFSPDGKTLAAGNYNSTVVLWNVRTGNEVATLKWPPPPVIRLEGEDQLVISIAFSPDGKTLASGHDDGTVRLWDVTTGKENASLKRNVGSVYSVAFSPDGKLLASGNKNETIILWDVKTGKETATIRGHANFVFSPNGRTLVSGSYDESIKVWDVRTGKETASVKGVWDWLRYGSVFSRDGAVFSPDGRTVALKDWEATIKLWDVKTGKEVAMLNWRTASDHIAFSPDGRTLAASGNGIIKLWDVKAAIVRRQVVSDVLEALPKLLGLAVLQLGFQVSAEPLNAVGLGSASEAVAELLRAGKVVACLLAERFTWETASLMRDNHDPGIIAFSPDGRILASERCGVIVLWDVKAGSVRK